MRVRDRALGGQVRGGAVGEPRGATPYHPEMTGERQLVQVELRFITTEDPTQLGERIRESVRLIVGREALEEFRVRTLPLVERKRPRGVE
jgi:hypothetical protein